MRSVSPAPHDTPLGFAYGNVIPDDEKLDLVHLGWMLGGKLLLGKAEVENVSCIISTNWSLNQLRELMEGLLDNDKSAINSSQNWVDRGDRSDEDLPLVIVNELDCTAYLCWARGGEDITTYGGLHNVREGSRKRIGITRQHATA